jgi:hypothetical protein
MLSYSNDGVCYYTAMLQWCLIVFPIASQCFTRCHNHLAFVSQCYRSGVTVVVMWCCNDLAISQSALNDATLELWCHCMCVILAV